MNSLKTPVSKRAAFIHQRCPSLLVGRSSRRCSAPPSSQPKENGLRLTCLRDVRLLESTSALTGAHLADVSHQRWVHISFPHSNIARAQNGFFAKLVATRLVPHKVVALSRLSLSCCRLYLSVSRCLGHPVRSTIRTLGLEVAHSHIVGQPLFAHTLELCTRLLVQSHSFLCTHTNAVFAARTTACSRVRRAAGIREEV